MTDKCRTVLYPFLQGPAAISSSYYQAEFDSRFFLPRYWGTWFLLGLMRLCGFLPLAVSHLIGAALGDLHFLLNAKRRRIARINIDLCFPQLPAEERERMVRRHFRASGISAIDLGLIWWGSERRLNKYVRITGLDELLALAAQGRDVVLLTGHFVTMELGGIYLSRFHPVIVMMKEIKNPLFNWFVWKGRTRFQGSTTLRRRGLRPLMRGIKEHKFCCYVPDEDFGPAHSVFVPFMGIPTATITALGKLVAKTGTVVVPYFARLLPGGRGYEIDVRPPLTGFPSGDPVEDARRMNEALEAGIRLAPEQYMWTFKWFKTRPDNAPSPYK